MADTFQASAGTGDGVVFASDDISSVHYPRVKVSWGADGSATDAAVAAPLPAQVSIESNQMTAAGTVVTPKFATISASTDNGDHTIVAAVTSKKVRVLSYVLIADAAVSFRWESGTGGTALTGVMALAANSGVASGYCPAGHFETASNTLLNLELTGTGNVAGHLTYIEV